MTLCLTAAFGCASKVVVLRPQRVVPEAELAQQVLHVLPSIDGAQDPLPLQGGDVTFAGVASTLGDGIAAATAFWADKHRAERPGGWELKVDLIESRAEKSHGRVSVELATRVTLSATLGRVYLAQTHGYCKHTDVVEGDPSASVYGCIEAMAHDIAGWLEGVKP